MTPDLQRLFEQEILVRPSDARPNVVHLVRALATLAGVRDLEQSRPTREIADAIGRTKHLIFVLIDGLGMTTLARLPKRCFLARHYAMTLAATCPSTTACALTSVATADYPNRHGVTGWFTHVPELATTVLALPFVSRHPRQPLTERGLRAEDVFPCPSVNPRMTHQPLTLLPGPIMDTPYARYARGHTPGLGYQSLTHAVDEMVARVSSAHAPTYTHLYLPDVDTACHHLGADHPDLLPVVLRIDDELERLAEALKGRARIVVSADHGLIDVLKSDQAFLTDGDPMLELLHVPPSGDARMPIFHVRSDQRDTFAEVFRDRFGDRMLLIATSEAERLELFGPGQMSAVARGRFGDFIGVAYRRATLAYAPVSVSGAAPVAPFIGQHAGLSPEEMLVPLCIA